MKFKCNDREKLFNRYELLGNNVGRLASELTGLRSILQNDVELSPEDLKQFQEQSARVAKLFEAQVAAVNMMKQTVMKSMVKVD